MRHPVYVRLGDTQTSPGSWVALHQCLSGMDDETLTQLCVGQ